jgi:hypothetical protein
MDASGGQPERESNLQLLEGSCVKRELEIEHTPCLTPLQAAHLFGRIRQSVACQAVPATLKSAFLEPVGSQLAAELSVEMVGRTDENFMGLFTGVMYCPGWRGPAATCLGVAILPFAAHTAAAASLILLSVSMQRRECCRRWRPAVMHWPSGWRGWCGAKTSSRSLRGAFDGTFSCCNAAVLLQSCIRWRSCTAGLSRRPHATHVVPPPLSDGRRKVSASGTVGCTHPNALPRPVARSVGPCWSPIALEAFAASVRANPRRVGER